MTSQEQSPGPVVLYQHDHPPVRNVLSEHGQKLTLGQRVADRLAAGVGSWPFILVQCSLLLLWIAANIYLAVLVKTHAGSPGSFDPYPFILLNLVLSFQAAFTGPVVMMSQNRASERDRLMAQHDYEINCTSERELQVVMDHLAHQDWLLADAVRRLEAMQTPSAGQSPADKIDEILKRMDGNDRRNLSLTNAAPDEQMSMKEESPAPAPADGGGAGSGGDVLPAGRASALRGGGTARSRSAACRRSG